MSCRGGPFGELRTGKREAYFVSRPHGTSISYLIPTGQALGDVRVDVTVGLHGLAKGEEVLSFEFLFFSFDLRRRPFGELRAGPSAMLKAGRGRINRTDRGDRQGTSGYGNPPTADLFTGRRGHISMKAV